MPRVIANALPTGFTTRFAPAPTGELHLGHIVNAIWVWGLARARAGRVLLRIEDHDRGRSRVEYERALLDDLDWLGLVPDGSGTEGFRGGAQAQRQSDNVARYAARLSELEARGDAYPCLCSRARSRAEIDQAYANTCRSRGVDPAATTARRVRMAPGHVEFDDLRLGAQSQDPLVECGDVLVRDRNGNFTYQFAVVVDDFEQGVDVVIRGEDLLSSTGRQLRIATLLGRADAPHFVHHPLVLHADGRKLSKSAGDSGVRELRDAGSSAQDVLGLAAHASGLAPTPAPLSPAALAGLFA